MKFVKINERQINIEQIVSISELNGFYSIRMANADEYRIRIDKDSEKLIAEVLGNADVQLPSKRTTTRTNRSIQ